MLKFHKIILLFSIVLISVIITDIFLRIHILIYAGIIITLIILLTYGSANLRAGFFCRAYCSAGMEKKSVALTFDDGPDNSITPSLLDLLREENIRAAFFCMGSKAEKDPDMVAKIDREGHIIGNHSYSHHFFFDLFSSRKMLEELQKTEDIIKVCINRKMKMFRPPYGVTNPQLAKAVKMKNYHVIGWSLRSMDTSIKSEEKLLKRITAKLKPGDIILFHDNREIAGVLEKFIKFAKENGFIFERLDTLLGIDAYE